tara:strand:- start:1186 stop:1527 length:342 start_codon:yes stop_codon:yes gene_type:complete
MSHWNHRLVKDVESGRLAIHEVFYDNDGTPTGYTEHPIIIDTFPDDEGWFSDFVPETPQAAIWETINRILDDIRRNDEIIYSTDFEKGGRYYQEDGLDALEKIEMIDKIGEPE